MTDSTSSQPLDGIAVVGIAGQFPGSSDCDEFWKNLREGREGLTFFTDEEVEAAGCDLGTTRGKRVRSRGVVDNADLFDAAFFGYTPREAEIMDPQQRVFLEVAWAALESAGFDPDRVPGAVGVYAGSSINTYYPNNVVSRPDVLGPFGVFPAIALNEKDFLATRVAYKLNLRGPAVSVQAACSTSLVAVCNACTSLLSFECDIALAGGIAINYPHCHSFIHEEGGMISADGHCKPFDKDASGTLFSDGAGVVALRRLEDAVESGDKILAVIKGYALNNDGSDKAGFTAPSINGQSEVIQMAQAFADIEPDTISYLEAHGTATRLGDPIEIAGLTQAFQARTEATQFCALGSVKSNIGHLDVAAGVAGLIKTVLMLHHKEIPPTIHYAEPNPQIDFASTPFFVADKLQDWVPPEGVPRRAGVSSFGIGGTNAHVVLEEAPALPPSGTSRTHQLLPLSARTREALGAAADNLAARLAGDDIPLADVAFTLQSGRYQFNQRSFIVCSDREDAQAKLGGDLPVLAPGRHNPPTAFMFPGQGAQRVNMGRELFDNERLYREIVDECAKNLEPELGLDLRNILFPVPGKEPWAEEQIVQTRITQPALFVTEYALARLWMSWGIEPQSMIGHSVGEYVAACLAGVFSLDDGLRLIAARGRLIQEQPTGTMLAVMTGEDTVRPLLVDGVTVATINAPTLCVVSGPHDAIESMTDVLADSNIESRPLHTSHAFHSEMMEPVVAPFTELLEGVELSAPTLPLVSNLTGQWIKDEEATDPAYWAQHMRQAVRFADGAQVLLNTTEHMVLLEVGPGATLTSLTRMHPAKNVGHVMVPSLASALSGDQSDMAIVLSALGRLWQAGVNIDWDGFYADEDRRRVPLPTYPFERKRYFLEPGHLDFSRDPQQVSADAPTTDSDPGGTSDLETAADQDTTVSHLQKILEALSGLSKEELGTNGHLLELGFDSLLLSRACTAIDAEFRVSITPRQISEELPTIADIAAYVESSAADIPDEPDLPVKKPVDAEDPAVNRTLPVSDAQREVWLAAQIDDDVSRTYNEARMVRIEGDLDIGNLQSSLQTIIDRHDVLRATFAEDGGSQTIAAHLDVDLTIEPLPAGGEVDQALNDGIAAAVTELFDLAAGPLFRFRLFDLGEKHSVLLMVIHHAVADGWSWALILDELGEIYSALASGESAKEHARPSYADYVTWTQSREWTEHVANAEDYWLQSLSDCPEELELPSDRARPARKSFASGRVQARFDPELLPRIKDAARKLDCTVFHFLTATFYAWLHRATGREDIVVAVPTAGQVSSAISKLGNSDRLVGHCVNMLPIRLQCRGEMSFSDFLAGAKKHLLEARDNQDISFQDLVNKLNYPRDPSRIPLASVSLNFAYDHQVSLVGLESITELPPKEFNFFDLTVDMIEGAEGLLVDAKFNVDLYDASTVERWLLQWQCIITESIARPNAALCDQDILSAAERAQLLTTWNKTEAPFPQQACLHELIDSQVEKTPDQTAAACGGLDITYAGLNQRANQFAHALRERGAGRGHRVGICIDRSMDMLAAVLGILKSGAAYVPLDPSFPEDRLCFMAEDAELSLLVSTTGLSGSFALPRAQKLLLDEDADVIDAQPVEPVALSGELDARPEDPAYVIYTSGSTGKPKGVMVPHNAVVNFLTSMARTPGICSSDCLLAVTTLSFDISVLELYLPLTQGATVVIATRDEATDGHALEKLIDTHTVGIMQATPVTWRLLLEAGWTGSPGFRALVGGESLPGDLAEQLVANGIDLWNMYGPTETTVWSTCCQVTDPASGISIGTPIDNTTIYILDDYKNVCPIGVPGELYIGGDGVTHGYWQRPELTADRFIDDPFGAKGGKIYGTGDKARWCADGTLEHLGRLDDQVKVRGVRIELGDIETNIATYPGISEAAVVAREDGPGDQRLIAYFVAETENDDLVGELRRHLGNILPDYMIPAHFAPMDALPRTQNGKLNRKALPEFDFTDARQKTQIELPATDTEKLIAAIWQDVLKLDQVGSNENFFELGGHSLLAMQISSRVQKELSMILPLREFLASPTIADQAIRADELGANDDSQREAEDVTLLRAGEIADNETVPLSFAQQRLWFLDQMEMVETTYLIPYALHIEGPLQVPALEKALNALVERHHSLRTTLPIDDDGPVQHVSDSGHTDLPFHDISSTPEQLETLIQEQMHDGFDLATGPLFRAVLYRLGADQHVLLTLQHHAISDAWSLGLLSRDLGTLYDDFANGRESSLPELAIQYADYAHWLRQRMQGDMLEQQLEYWRTQLDGAPQVLEMPTDRPRPAIESHRGAHLAFDISNTVQDGIAALCQSEGTTQFMVLLAALDVLLLRYTGQDDLLVGVPVANRNREDLEELIGMFVNTLIIRNDVSGDPSTKELLGRVRERCLDAYAHQELPVEILVEHLEPGRDLSRNPLFQIMLILEDKTQQPGFCASGLKAESQLIDRGATHIDLTLYIEDSQHGLTGIFEYATDLFDESTIARMAEQWHSILETMVEKPDSRISSLASLTEDERQKLLVDWNGTERDFPRSSCLHQVIENQADQTPDRAAVASRECPTLTYAQLDARANQFANALRERGIRSGTHVGICIERSTEMLAAVLGILKSGAAYVPLDPAFPSDRLQFMAEDAQLALLLSTKDLASGFDLPSEKQLLIDADAGAIDSQPTDRPVPAADLDAAPGDAAYLIYTSGSTGTPKGVVVPHSAAVNFLGSMAREPGLTTDDILVAVTTLSFDIAVLELYLPLTVGATVVIASHEEAVDGTALKGLFETHGATIMQATPVTWRLLLEAGWSGGAAFKALVGGEALPRDLADQLIATDVELWNMYGPTETTVWSTCCHVADTSDGITIGTPIDNTRIYVLDEQKNLCPIGVPGELYIGGDGVTLGYWKRPDLTADRFIPDAFTDTPNATMYGTGDKARWLNDGTLQHLGRFDDQIKVRGYRVELGEIEARIAEHPDVRQAAVHLWSVGDDDVRIVACCIPQVPGRMSNVSLRKHLRSCLPKYMIPQYFMIVEDISLTPNGKVDRRRLPIPAVAESSIERHEAPEGPVEKAIAEVWTELIHPARPIGRTDKFFDMGGHSLLAIRAIRKMEQEVEAQLDFRILFHENLAEIAAKYARGDSA